MLQMNISGTKAECGYITIDWTIRKQSNKAMISLQSDSMMEWIFVIDLKTTGDALSGRLKSIISPKLISETWTMYGLLANYISGESLKYVASSQTKCEMAFADKQDYLSMFRSMALSEFYPSK